ncbi:MAG: hypothetical protein RL300_698 [Pseudomonadota bacterium]
MVSLAGRSSELRRLAVSARMNVRHGQIGVSVHYGEMVLTQWWLVN